LQLIKATACLAINAGEFNYSRPTVRLFYTQGFWNDGAKAAFLAGMGGNRIAQGVRRRQQRRLVRPPGRSLVVGRLA